MQPFPDDREAARLRAEAQAEERAREERTNDGPRPARLLLLGRALQYPLAIIVLFAALVAKTAGSCHRVTPAEYAAMTKRTTRKAVSTESRGPVPFDTTACELRVQGHSPNRVSQLE